MILLLTVLVNRLGLNRRNSSKPPSSDYGDTRKKAKEKVRTANARREGNPAEKVKR
jgi:hypothetical protein